MIAQRFSVSAHTFALSVMRLGSVALPAPESYLSESELDRLARFKHDCRRAEFLAGRWLLRTLWQDRFGGELADFVLQERESQAPVLLSVLEWRELSISHGGGFVAAAIAPKPIGIDVEASTRTLNPHVFTKLLGEMSESALDARALLERWVACESLLKQHGTAALPENIRAFAVRPATPEQTVRCWTRSIQLQNESALLGLAVATEPGFALEHWQPYA
jgi:phosphopantetheinyl transferase